MMERNALHRNAVILLLLATSISLALAIPGYHVSDGTSAKRAVQQFAGDSFKFRAVVFQAQLDKSVWRLTVAAHDFLRAKPDDPERECSFAEAYWQARQALRKADMAGETDTELVPADAARRLTTWELEAIECTKDAVRQMPNSVAVHLNYGYYIQYFDLMNNPQSIGLMLREYRHAVALRPDLGDTHYALANGYMGSGIHDSQTVALETSELKRALTLSPRLTQAYYALSALYAGPTVHDYKTSRFYLNKYLQLNPQEANSPIVTPMDKFLKEKGD